MIKKIFKIIGILLLCAILLSVLSYYSFLGWEYITGSEYVEYIENNKETVKIEESFTYEILDKDIRKHSIILVGESHGFEEPTIFDVDFFKHLHSKFGVKKYIAELDFVQATLMNRYLENGNDSLLHVILKNWIVAQGRNNKDYFDKYKEFHNYYQQLSEGERFKFIGIDLIQDWPLTTSFVNNLGKPDSSIATILYNSKTVLDNLKINLNQIVASDIIDKESKTIANHLLQNINYKKDKVNREEVMFLNFTNLYKHNNFYYEKLYGFFGLYHIFQYRVNNDHPFASKVRMSDLGLENKILSINFLFTDSHMVMKSSMLPEFMRDKGKYTKMPVSSDNVLVIYIYGIQDFKRTTPEFHKSIVKMNGENNPYSKSNRLNTTIQLLPVTDIFEMNDKGKPYVQYTIFVRNSDWAEPMKK